MRSDFFILSLRANIMKAILSLIPILLILLTGCGQFTPDEETGFQFTGKVKDPSGNALSDVKVFLVYHFDYWGGTQDGPASPASGAYLEQNYPNPFTDTTTFIYYILAETSFVSFDIVRFDSLVVLPGAKTDTLAPGTYRWVSDFSRQLPSNGYKALMNVTEGDSSYVLERSFIRSYYSFDSSIIYTEPNTVSSNGRFEIPYKTLPIDQIYVRTMEAEPSPQGNLKVNEVLTIVLYKPGYHIYKEDVTIHLDRYLNKEFILQPE
jgi:hypothetical protein